MTTNQNFTLKEVAALTSMSADPTNPTLRQLAMLRTAQYRLGSSLFQSRDEWILFAQVQSDLINFVCSLLNEGKTLR